MSIPCDASGVVNENPENMTQRYDAAGVPRMSLLEYPHSPWKNGADLLFLEAWHDLMDGWNSYYPNPTGGVDETFVMYYSNAFHLTEGRVVPLDDPLCGASSCPSDGITPASYLIEDRVAMLNTVSISPDPNWAHKLRLTTIQYLSNIVSGYQQASDAMQSKLEDFASTFAKIPNQNADLVTKILLDVGLFLSLALIPTGFAECEH